MKGNLFIDFLIQKDFLNTRSRQWSFLLTNQNAHLITHEPMKFCVTKVKSKFKASASKRASWKWLSALNPAKSLGEMPKVRWKQRKYLKDLRFCEKRTSRWMSLRLIALERDVNLPDLAVREDGWKVESLIVPCEVLLVWSHSTSRPAASSLLQQSRRLLNPSFWWAIWYILPSLNGHFWNIWQPKHSNRSVVQNLISKHSQFPFNFVVHF